MRKSQSQSAQKKKVQIYNQLDLSTEIDDIIDSASDDQKKSKYMLDDLNNKVTAKKKDDPVN